MKIRSYIQFLAVIGVIAFIVVLPVVFSRAQQDTANTLLQNSASAATEEQIAALAEARKQAFYNNRVPYPACPNCFKIGDGRYGIYEAVPGTDKVLSRDLPDPAPLGKGKVRPDKDDETGEPIWYIGTQGFVGPTDDEPLSDSLPIPKIELKRIQARHAKEIFRIGKGVHRFGIGENGFIVAVLPGTDKSFIPSAIEGIPVQIEETGLAQKASHQFQRYRPVPVGAGFTALGSGYAGTIGPHAVRDIADISTCCVIWSLTAGHVLQDNYLPPTDAIGDGINQGGAYWGIVDWVFQLQRCDPDCGDGSGPVNDMRVHPDVGALVQVSEPTTFPMSSPCSGSAKPVRRMEYGVSSFVHGPDGVIRIPTFSTCGSGCLKLWGAFSDAPKGRLYATNVLLLSNGGGQYLMEPMDEVSLERAAMDGDSGSLVAWNGSNNRQVAGLMTDQLVGNAKYIFYIRADYIKSAFYSAGRSFDHYWGTASSSYRPSTSQYDFPC